ncbi:unnamed protein product, partial [Prunus brigantina]
IPTSILQFRTPLQTLQHQCQIPPTQNLEPRIFGCVVFVHLHDHQRSKLDPRAEKCVFIGYAPHQKGYRFYHPPSQKVYTSMDVAFREQESYFLDAQEDPSHISESFTPVFFPDSFQTQNDLSSIYRDQSPDDNDRSPAVNDRIEEFMLAPENSSAPVPHQSSAEDVIQVTSLPETDNINETDCISEGAEPTYQIPKRTNRGKPPVHYEADINAKGKYPINNYVSLTRLSESRVHFVKQLAEIPVPNSVTEALEDKKWKEAMNEEMRALQKNGTWELVPLPHGKKTVGCRWIYTVKLKADGSVERYKARLVAKGYTQRYGIDYQETFAPVAKIKTIRILLSIAANLDWPLKQSPRAWFGRFTKSMKVFGYTQSNADHTLFLKRDGKKLTALIVYVDDIVVTGDDTGEQLKLQKYLSQEFEMKDLGDLKYFLEIEVARSANDADWAGSITDRRSTSGYFTFVGGNLVTWRSKKQNVVSRSSAEAEYRGMAHGVCELLWIKRLLTELGFKPGKPMELHCDNNSAIDIAHNPVQHDRTKHVEVDRHFIKEKIEKKIIRLPFVESEDQLADILTKAVCSRVFYDSLTKLGIGDIYAPT